MKKVFKGNLLGLVSLLSVGLVSAQTNFDEWGANLAGGVQEFFNAIYLNPQNYSTILLGILLFMVIYSVIKKMSLFGGSTNWILSTVAALIVTILSFIAIPDNFVETILLQYGAMGATLLTAIPFIIIVFFTFTVLDNLILARAVWLMYIFYYFSIFIFKVGEGSDTFTQAFTNVDNIPYLGAIILGIIIFFFIKAFRNFLFKGKLEGKEEKGLRELDLGKLGRKLDAKRAEDIDGPR